MLPIATLFLTPADQAALAAALAGVATLESCDHPAQLSCLTAARRVDAVVAELRGEVGANPVSVILALKAQAPTRPTVLSVALSPTSARHVASAVGLGIEAWWTLRGRGDLGEAVRRALCQQPHGSAETAILRAMLPVSSAPVRPFLTFAAISATRPSTVHEAATAAGISARTIERRLAAARLPRPARVLGWCRVLHAAWHLDVLTQPPKRVVAELHFPSLPALHNLLRDYTGLTPAALPERGGFPALLTRFERLLRDEGLPHYAAAPSIGA